MISTQFETRADEEAQGIPDFIQELFDYSIAPINYGRGRYYEESSQSVHLEINAISRYLERQLPGMESGLDGIDGKDKSESSLSAQDSAMVLPNREDASLELLNRVVVMASGGAFIGFILTSQLFVAALGVIIGVVFGFSVKRNQV